MCVGIVHKVNHDRLQIWYLGVFRVKDYKSAGGSLCSLKVYPESGAKFSILGMFRSWIRNLPVKVGSSKGELRIWTKNF